MAILFAATYPDRSWALVLEGAYARTLWAPDYQWGTREQEFERELAEGMQGWGTREHSLGIARALAPSGSGEDWEPLAKYRCAACATSDSNSDARSQPR